MTSSGAALRPDFASLCGRRILILAPHPDDEVLGCAIAARRALAAGAELAVLDLTTGVPARAVLWPWARGGHGARVARRLAEAVRARRLLGLHRFELPVPVRPTRRLRFELPQAFAELRAAVEATAADAVWVPAYEGGHPDHDCANALVARLRAEGWAGRCVEFAEYTFAGGAVLAQRFAGPLNPGTVELAPSPAEWVAKVAALGAYASERDNLTHVNPAGEALRPLPVHDYRQPPHAGPRFYERFHWVPFRHPRIDRTTAADVCASVVEWWPGAAVRQ